MAKNYGTGDQIIQSITFDDDSDENPKGVIVYAQVGTLADVKDKAPAIGSKSGHFPANCLLQHRSFSFSNENTVTVTLTYQPNEDGTDGTADSDDESAAASYEMNVSIGTQSLAEHESLNEKQKKVVKMLLDGASPADYCAAKQDGDGLAVIRLGDVPDEEKETQLKNAGFDIGTFEMLITGWFGSSDDGAKIVEKVMQGFTTYDVAAATFHRTTYGGSISEVLKKIGKKGHPIGAPSGDWLYIGANCEKSATDRQWKITEEWKLGSNGELDSTIYKEEG